MKIYYTKYALTTGVKIIEVIKSTYNEKTYVDVNRDTILLFGEYNKINWYISKKDAEIRVEDMRKKKIISLKKKINKIKNLTFAF